MSIGKEKLSAVNGLFSSVNTMDDNQFNEYCKTLFAFIENFPPQETELKRLFGEKDYNAFNRTLSGVHDMLEGIQATGLAQSCHRLLVELGDQKYNIVEAHLSYLLAEISGLSIDIQMALHESGAPGKIAPKPNPPAAPAPVETQPKKKNILAVDDVSFLLMGLKTVLQNTEYTVTGVTSGRDALKYVEKHTPDLFILDIEMPEMDGYELAERLKRSGQTAPIIFLTGNATSKYVQKAIAVGAVDFIVKPVNKDQVIDKIKKQIG